MTDDRSKSANDIKCWAGDDPTDQLREMFVDIIQQKRIDLGQKPARRPVFLKPHGVAQGWFEMRPDLPDDLKVGVFALDKLDVWVRFSSDTTPNSKDLKTTCGCALKVFGVPGKKLMGGGDTQDFILQNHDVFFVNTAKDMAEFTTAGVVDKDYDTYLDTHPTTQRILEEMAKPVASCLTTPYWGILPYAFGSERYVKYKLEPEDASPGEPFDDRNYLAVDLQRRLRKGPARFKFLVQFRTNPKTMPLDEATVRWSEKESEPVHIATVHLPQQDINEEGQLEYGEHMSFNPWHCLPEHEPQGSIAAARKVVYHAGAEKRHRANGLPTQEPEKPRPLTKKDPDNEADCIVSAAIYPPIGVCRVGNSDNEFFIGPEVTHPLPEKPGFYRDATGALKRQAARFRVYGLNAKGHPVKELTADEADIHWHVHIANQKSAWYEFQLALDIPEAADAPPSLLRNSTVSDRSQLVIDPGKAQINGCKQNSDPLNGQFMGRSVYLGELRTDDKGRLIVLGGRGVSASYDGTQAVTFANNEGWHDDTSDGPVTARVEYQGVALKVEPAWVITAPPNYAPLQKSVRTMWDLMRSTAIDAGMLARPERPSFTRDILPIFERMTRLQWTNAGFASAFGHGGPFDFTTPQWIVKLGANTSAYREMRRNLANEFRRFERDAWSPVPFPWLYGDAMSIPPAQTPRQHATLSDLQLAFLDQWAEGDFDADYDPKAEVPRRLEDVPEREQPDMLTQAAMDFCLADAFHPGCEMTWPMRHAGLYKSAFRLKHAPKGWKEPGYGAQMNTDVTSLPKGPLNGGQVPGSITRWMAVPWQTDTASCRSGYDTSYDPYVPTFWPARVPNQVMSEKEYDTVMDTDRELGQRLEAFANRADWLAPLNLDKGYTHQINHMIHHFDEMGVLEVRPGLPNDPHFPAQMEVENRKPDTASKHLQTLAPTDTIEDEDDEHDLSHIEKVRRFHR